jgi:hypothetical protein
VTVAGFLINPTLYQIKRPAWPQLAGMMALPIHCRPWEPSCFWWRLKLMASASFDEVLIG